jgi:hypothetical protein
LDVKTALKTKDDTVGVRESDGCMKWLALEAQAAIEDPRPSIPHEEVMLELDPMLKSYACGQSA